MDKMMTDLIARMDDALDCVELEQDLDASFVSLLEWNNRECCYACDAAPCGYRDRRPEGGIVERACRRHAEWV